MDLNVLQESPAGSGAQGTHDAPPRLRSSLPRHVWHRTPTGPVREALARRRVETTVEAVGFPRPPCEVHLTFAKSQGRWLWDADWPPCEGSAPLRWVESLGPAVVRVTDAIAPHGLQAEFRHCADAWTLLDTVAVETIHLFPTGRASVFVSDSPQRIDGFLTALRSRDADAVARPRLDGRRDDPLTARQREVLGLAVALGYYDVPRRITLRGLAARLDIGCGTISELLRRAERSVIHAAADETA